VPTNSASPLSTGAFAEPVVLASTSHALGDNEDPSAVTRQGQSRTQKWIAGCPKQTRKTRRARRTGPDGEILLEVADGVV